MPEYQEGAVPPQACICYCLVSITVVLGNEEVSAHGYDDGGLCGQLVRDVGVHLDLGWVTAPVCHLLQRRTEASGRGEGEAE